VTQLRDEGWQPDDPHSEAPTFGDEGGASDWGGRVGKGPRSRAFQR
jgi:hypothetical protein